MKSKPDMLTEQEKRTLTPIEISLIQECHINGKDRGEVAREFDIPEESIPYKLNEALKIIKRR